MRSYRWFATAVILTASQILAQQVPTAFDAPVIGVGALHRITGLLDLDGDAAVDAVGWWWNLTNADIRVTGFKNVGGTYVAQWSVAQVTGNPIGDDVVGDAIGDFNNDGFDDFVVASVAGATIYRNVAPVGGTLSMPIATSITGFPSAPRAVAAGDVTGDGIDDLIVAGANWISVRASTLSGFAPPTIIQIANGSGTPELDIGDVDQDGDDDIIRTDAAQISIHVMQSGVVQSTVVFAHAVVHPMTAFGDIDQDGDGDITIFDDANYIVLRSAGAGNFTLEAPRSGGPAYALADVDQDGDLDGICCAGGTSQVSNPYANNTRPATFHISLNDGTGNFAPAFTIPALGSLHIAGAEDIDADGDVDLVAGRSIYYARGPLSGPVTPVTGLSTEESRIASDIDRDGDRDAALDFSAFMRSNSAGEFTSQPMVIPPPPAGKVYLAPAIWGDFDADGDDDIIVRTATLAGQVSTPRRLMQIGGGIFQSAGNATGGGTAFMPPNTDAANAHVFKFDADADGDLDLVTANIDLSTMIHPTKLWLNDGSGFFTLSTSWQGSFIPADSGDFNGDGFVDLVGTATGVVSARFGVGGGNFVIPIHGQVVGPEWGLYTFPQLRSNSRGGVIARDFDVDGDLDVLVLSTTGFVIFSNTPNGFSAPALVGATTEYRPVSEYRLDLADVNGDGRDDFIDNAVPFIEESVRVVLWNPASTFHDIEIIHAGDFFFIDDVDGDGDPDAVGRHLLRGFAREGAAAGARRQYGSGFAGSAGITPQISIVTPVREGTTCELLVSAGLGGSFAWVAYGLEEASLPVSGFPGITVAVDPIVGILPLPLNGAPGAPGQGFGRFTYAAPLGVAGLKICVQAAIIDPGSPVGFSMTQGLEKIYGF